MAEPIERFRFVEMREALVIELALPAHIETLEFDSINVAIGQQVLLRGPAKWVVDLSGAQYIGSALLGMLINLRSRVRSTKGRLVLCRLPPMLERVMRAGSMEKLFTIVADREAAFAIL